MNRIEGIKQLRALYNVSVSFAREAFDASNGDMTKAGIYIKANWRAEDGKTANSGLVYTHHHPQDSPRIGVMLEVRCGTDFVARSDTFKALCRELALQVIAGLDGPLSDQPYVRDSSRTVANLLTEYSQKLGETIYVERSARWTLGGATPSSIDTPGDPDGTEAAG